MRTVVFDLDGTLADTARKPTGALPAITSFGPRPSTRHGMPVERTLPS